MTIIAKSKYLEFKKSTTQTGKEWHYVKRTNDSTNHDSAVVITTLVKIENEYNFLFLLTKRPPLCAENKSEYCVELPAGLIGDIDKNETLEECIQKELLEETGLIANKIIVDLKNSATSAGLSSETLSFVTAIVENYELKATPVNDDGIISDRFFVKASEVYNYIENLDQKKYSLASPTVTGIFFGLKNLH